MEQKKLIWDCLFDVWYFSKVTWNYITFDAFVIIGGCPQKSELPELDKYKNIIGFCKNQHYASKIINIQNHILAAQSVAESLSIIIWLMTFTPTTPTLWPFYIFLEVFLHTKKYTWNMKIWMRHKFKACE